MGDIYELYSFCTVEFSFNFESSISTAFFICAEEDANVIMEFMEQSEENTQQKP